MRNVIFLVLLAFFAGFLTKPNKITAQAPVDPDTPTPEELQQCAKDLTEYMDTALAEMGSLKNIKKVSIAFNMTSPFEREIFKFMDTEYNADWDKLDYFAGNTYTLLGARGGTTAMAYYLDGWASWFSGKDVIFTEFGDFRTAEQTMDNRWSLIGEMKTEYGIAASRPEIAGVNYFAALPESVMGGGNPEFEFHNLSEAELKEVVSGGNIKKSGVNPGVELGSATKLPEWLASHGMPWTLAIITGPNAEGTANWVNSLPGGINPIIRLCWGSSCGFKDPLVLADFAKQLDSLVNKTTYLIIGPNEPLTDPWVSEACGAVEERDWEWEPVECQDTVDPEFHSLRPYPGNFCVPGKEPVKKVLQCGNKITAAEDFDLEWQEDKMSVWGVSGPESGPCIEKRVEVILYYDTVARSDVPFPTYVRTWICNGVPIQSTTQLTIDMTDSELPVLGNTEDVPNGRSGTSSLTYENRVNNYVSWYLQGAVQRAEEDYQSPTDPIGIRNIIDFAGPLQKLYPLGGVSKDIYRGPNGLQGRNLRTGMVAQRWGDSQENLDLGQDHNQIVVCKQGGPEACYVDNTQERLRKETVRDNPLRLEFSYIPLSVTGDEVGEIKTKRTGAQPGIEHGNEMGYLPPEATRIVNEPDFGTVPWQKNENLPAGINWSDMLFFPHARESVQLADALQRTFVPQDALRQVWIASYIGADSAYDGQYSISSVNKNDWMDSASGMPPVLPPDYEEDQFCVIRNAYTNPGDNLYGWLEKEDVLANPAFTETADFVTNITTEIIYEGEVSCTFSEEIGEGFDECMAPVRDQYCTQLDTCLFEGGEPVTGDCSFGEVMCRKYRDSEAVLTNNPESCIDRRDPKPCSTTTMASSEVELEVPWVEVIWNRLVNGSMSVYRHLFPRLAANNLSLPPEDQIITPGPEQFQNIPGYTTAKYKAKHLEHLDTSEGGASGFVANTGAGALAGDPKDGNSEGELYFPYLGSIHKYFLRGVQCAFLPAGIGCDNIEPTLVQDNKGADIEANCSVVPDSQIPARYLALKATFIDLADRWVPNDEDSHHAEKCFNDVIKRSLAAGVNPLFTLAIWLNESDASNYAASSLAWEDFGIHTAGSPENFNDQITRFLSLARNFTGYQTDYPSCYINAGEYGAMAIWMSIFHLGPSQCRDGIPDLTYYNAINNGSWAFITNCAFPTSPTDMSCR